MKRLSAESLLLPWHVDSNLASNGCAELAIYGQLTSRKMVVNILLGSYGHAVTSSRVEMPVFQRRDNFRVDLRSQALEHMGLDDIPLLVNGDFDDLIAFQVTRYIKDRISSGSPQRRPDLVAIGSTHGSRSIARAGWKRSGVRFGRSRRISGSIQRGSGAERRTLGRRLPPQPRAVAGLLSCCAGRTLDSTLGICERLIRPVKLRHGTAPHSRPHRRRSQNPRRGDMDQPRKYRHMREQRRVLCARGTNRFWLKLIEHVTELYVSASANTLVIFMAAAQRS